MLKETNTSPHPGLEQYNKTHTQEPSGLRTYWNLPFLNYPKNIRTFLAKEDHAGSYIWATAKFW